jgi:DNA (cytosine-5)-methyltransferase 1
MLRQLMKDGIIPMGDVDERSITEVKADEIRNYTQCHFFAGIGGWSIALRIAEWPEDRQVWTGSCPCQPFSSAGKQKGKQDERHLLPTWLGLIAECSPASVYGEQVSSAIAHGWLDDVYQGLEAQGYAVGSAVLPACSVGAPHKRDRLWFVGHSEHNGQFTTPQLGSDEQTVSDNTQGQNSSSEPERASGSCDVANTYINNEERRSRETSSEGQEVRLRNGLDITDAGSFMANSIMPRPQGHRGLEQESIQEGREGTQRHSWQGGVWIDCPDGKQRLIEPSICLLADGVQFRKPILHAFGNAIVPPLASEFIKASM